VTYERVPQPPPRALEEAAATLSAGGRFFFSKRNLYYELIRRGVVPAPSGNPARALNDFRVRLRVHHRDHGRLPGLIRAATQLGGLGEVPLDPDVLDYAVRRVIGFDRLDLFLLFAMNGFHRKLEIGLLVMPDFPPYVWKNIDRQLAAGFKTTFYAVHDSSRAGYLLRKRLRALLAPRGKPKIVDVGLHFAQAFHLGVPVRTIGRTTPDPDEEELDEEARLLLTSGSYAHVEELTPLAMMQWAYARLARGYEEAGFG
jgi:hypothetical protein